MSLGTNFHLKLTFLIVTKFTQKGYFQSEIGQMDLTMDFEFEFELVQMQIPS